MASPETRRMVLAAVAACEDKKAENTRVLELDPMDSGFTDFFVVTSASNERQALAIADEIELRLKRDFSTYPNSVEGRRQGEWVLLDYVDFVVHIFQTEKRAFYDIERLRKSARNVDTEELKTALAKKTAAARKKSPAKKAAGKTSAANVAVAPKKAAKKSVATKGARPAKKSSAAKKPVKKSKGD
jgi:ribosome-associated protein